MATALAGVSRKPGPIAWARLMNSATDETAGSVSMPDCQWWTARASPNQGKATNVVIHIQEDGH